MDRATVCSRRVLEAALRRGASALIFAHKFPNVNVEPSERAKLLTRASSKSRRCV
jgi:DNA repair protein RadC